MDIVPTIKSEQGAVYAINRLINKGILEKRGAGRKVYYVLSESEDKLKQDKLKLERNQTSVLFYCIFLSCFL